MVDFALQLAGLGVLGRQHVALCYFVTTTDHLKSGINETCWKQHAATLDNESWHDVES